MSKQSHNWKTYRHSTRGLALTACETCGVTRYTQGYPQQSCSGEQVQEPRFVKLGYVSAEASQTGKAQTL